MKRGSVTPAWNRELARFPAPIRDALERIRGQGGMLRPAQVQRIATALALDIEPLMLELLPLAACFAVAPVSDFRVGAIVAGPGRFPTLYFGANLELAGGALGFSVHAEQAAINHAWLQGEHLIARLAVTAAPCGHCRQFIAEMHGARSLRILLPGSQPVFSLGELLPAAFGPDDLKVRERLLQPVRPRRLRFEEHDSLVRAAANAAAQSHAPYSRALAGCALQLDNGAVAIGRSAENAAYNPTLPAISSALSAAVLQNGLEALHRVARAVLVQTAGGANQAALTRAVLGTCSPNAVLECSTAVAI